MYSIRIALTSAADSPHLPSVKVVLGWLENLRFEQNCKRAGATLESAAFRNNSPTHAVQTGVRTTSRQLMRIEHPDAIISSENQETSQCRI
jgi:hypothetical protein